MTKNRQASPAVGRAPYTAAFYTLGCRVNQYETRAVEETFAARGFCIASFDEPCDVYVINTCTVTAESDRKSRQLIRRARKTGGPDALVLAMGCMVAVSPEQAANIHGLDYAVGNRNKTSLADIALTLLRERKTGNVSGSPTLPPLAACGQSESMDHMRITGSDHVRAFLKIADGCDNRCSYCIIPKARGPVRSKSPEAVCAEVSDIVRGGCREVVLTGIETAAYGKDLADIDLVSLIEQVNAIYPDAPDRIRLGSLEPTVIKQQTAARFAACHRLMPHYHLSLQSGSDAVLAAMRRKYNTRMFADVVGYLRTNIPDVTVTTDIIVGFPGETEEMFEQTVEFVRACGFLFVHIFPYSDRAGTEASARKDKVDEAEKKRRAARLKKAMLDVRADVLHRFVGSERSVLIETISDSKASGYTENYIETVFDVSEHPELRENDIATVKITGVADDLSHVNAVRIRKEGD